MRAFLLLVIAFGLSAPSAEQPINLGTLTLPAGFTIAVYSDQLPNARELALGANGTVFAGSREAGKVYALTSTKHDGHADLVRVIASGLQVPSGIAFHNGDLYIGAVSRIYVLRDIERHLDAPPKPELITDKLPDKTHHGWKFLAFGPDGRLYVPIGAPATSAIRARISQN